MVAPAYEGPSASARRKFKGGFWSSIARVTTGCAWSQFCSCAVSATVVSGGSAAVALRQQAIHRIGKDNHRLARFTGSKLDLSDWFISPTPPAEVRSMRRG